MVTADRWSNVSLRRNMFLNNYADNCHSAGGYFSRIDGLLFEENLFDYNGWNEDAGVGATMFSHNLYPYSKKGDL
ncbi:hypothetical protein MHK_008608 [Candidatus Magnetomorum sp. HK-1]|nr:hypothetical protein MHK_008608 [Candidatus Magnetomorum sp. HK-1]